MDVFSCRMAEAYLLAQRSGFTATADALCELAQFDEIIAKNTTDFLLSINQAGPSFDSQQTKVDEDDNAGTSKEA